MNNTLVMAHKTASVVWEPLPHARSLQKMTFFFLIEVDLQCRASLCCTAKGLSLTHICILINTLLHYGLSHIRYSSLCWMVGPVAYPLYYLSCI